MCRPDVKRCQAINSTIRTDEANSLEIRRYSLDIHLRSLEMKEKEMNSSLKVLCAGGLLALTSFMTKPAMADEWNKKTEFQFNEPVEIPGKVLMPGKYVFELLDSDSNRYMVQIFSEDSKGKESLIETIQAVPDQASTIRSKPTIQFEERPAGSPEAIHSWFYPGDRTGWEFVYSKGRNPAPAPEPAAGN
jgi:hypothetical protein